MSKPNVTGLEVSAMPFETRVQLVHEEIQRRKAEANPEQPGAYVARLWCNWIRKNILDVPAGTEVAV